MKNTLANYIIGLAIAAMLIFMSYFLPSKKDTEGEKNKKNQNAASAIPPCPECDSSAKEILDSIQKKATQNYALADYKILQTRITDYTSSGNINEEIPDILNQALDNTYCNLIAQEIENFVKTQQNTNGLDNLVNELNSLKFITTTQPLKDASIRSVNNFKDACAAINNAASFFGSLFVEGRASILTQRLSQIENTDFIKENSLLINTANDCLDNLKHFKNVDVTYKQVELTQNYLRKNATELAQDNNKGPVFKCYILKFQILIDKINGKPKNG
jgi:hypothetical protein